MSFKERTLSSKLLYEGKILKLRRDEVEVRNGTSYREIVEHNGGSVIVAVDELDNLIMVRQYRKPFETEILELPAGKIEYGEGAVETAVRELAEETGYRAGKIEKITSIYPSVGYTTEVLHIFLAVDLEKGEPCFDENEDLDILLIPYSEAVDMVMRGEIKDSKSIAGILMGEKLR